MPNLQGKYVMIIKDPTLWNEEFYRAAVDQRLLVLRDEGYYGYLEIQLPAGHLFQGREWTTVPKGCVKVCGVDLDSLAETEIF